MHASYNKIFAFKAAPLELVDLQALLDPKEHRVQMEFQELVVHVELRVLQVFGVHRVLRVPLETPGHLVWLGNKEIKV
jgi:hypothetical protein